MQRHDYAFPFRIDATSHQAAQTGYEAHVEQMIRQVLLTSPGERADLPEFGCGLRQLIFAPHSDALDATTQIIVLQALDKWLSSQIQVKKVRVVPPEETGDAAQLLVQIEYVLIETRTNKSLEILVF
jgi:phage baseplate assembly protein W